MKLGMLWFDNDKNSTLSDKIKRAVDYYQSKYGIPTTCHVHPSEYDGTIQTHGVSVYPDKGVLKNHLWLGVADD